jgi:hypothetical protein
MLTSLLPLLQKLGLGNLLADLSRAQVEKRMRKGFPSIKRTMLKNGTTPVNLSDTEAERRQLIRAALYHLWKAVLKSGTAADVVRDSVDDKVVALLSPAIAPTMTQNELLEAVLVTALDVVF